MPFAYGLAWRRLTVQFQAKLVRGIASAQTKGINVDVQDYLIAIYFIVAYVCLLTLVVAAAFAVFVFLQRRALRAVRDELEALKSRLPEKSDVPPSKNG